MRFYSNLPTYTKILLGMLAGVIIGIIAANLGGGEFIKNWVTPFGEVFIRLLKLIAIPLVLLSLIKGIGSLQDISELATMGVKTLMLYVGSTVIAIVIGVILVTTIKPGEMVSQEVSQSISSSYTESINTKKLDIEKVSNQSPLQPLVDIVPENAIRALGDNSSMLQVIILAVLIGVATILVGSEASRPFLDFISSMDSIIIKCIDIIMGFAPFGVMSLIATMVCESSGDMSLLGALGLYVLTVVIGLFPSQYG